MVQIFNNFPQVKHNFTLKSTLEKLTCWKNCTLRYPNGGMETASFWPREICWKVDPSGGEFL